MDKVDTIDDGLYAVFDRETKTWRLARVTEACAFHLCDKGASTPKVWPHGGTPRPGQHMERDTAGVHGKYILTGETDLQWRWPQLDEIPYDPAFSWEIKTYLG